MSDNAVSMELLGVRIEYPTNQPIVLLREVGGTLAIWRFGSVPWKPPPSPTHVEGVTPQRPFTHDLLRLTTEALGAQVDRVTVTELRESVYYADLVFAQEGEEVHVSSRPSDAIALAARTGAPLYATEERPGRTPESRSRTRTRKKEVERFKRIPRRPEPRGFQAS